MTVFWRPLHEASGYQGDGWFWWGRKRGDGESNARAYILLYPRLFDRLVNVHGLRAMQAVGQVAHPVALTENSFIPDPDRMRADGARWLWFMTWNDGHAPAGATDKNNFWSGDYYNTAAHKQQVYHHPDVITLDQLPAFLKAP